jgi:hypothetical protein
MQESQQRHTTRSKWRRGLHCHAGPVVSQGEFCLQCPVFPKIRTGHHMPAPPLEWCRDLRNRFGCRAYDWHELTSIRGSKWLASAPARCTRPHSPLWGLRLENSGETIRAVLGRFLWQQNTVSMDTRTATMSRGRDRRRGQGRRLRSGTTPLGHAWSICRGRVRCRGARNAGLFCRE